ncbi:hypothetical protein ACK3TF_005219 [Chlorella vulgaris]
MLTETMEFKVLNFNVDTRGPAVKSKEAICELLKREQPDIIILQESRWTKRGKVLRQLLAGGAAVAGESRDWVVEEQPEGRLYNTVIYDGSLFTAKAYNFEDLGIDPQDLRTLPRLAALHKARPWLYSRYLLLHLISKDKKRQLYVISWHGLWTGMKYGEHADNTRCFLSRAALLAEKKGIPVLIGGDFNYAMEKNMKTELPDLLEDFKARGISFAVHTPAVSYWDAAHAWCSTTVAACKAADTQYAAQLAVRPVQQVQAAYAKREEALRILDAILARKRKQGGEIDFICTLGLKEHWGCGSAPSSNITCTSRASHVTVFGGFDHSPLMATFKMACAAPAAASGYTADALTSPPITPRGLPCDDNNTKDLGVDTPEPGPEKHPPSKNKFDIDEIQIQSISLKVLAADEPCCIQVYAYTFIAVDSQCKQQEHVYLDFNALFGRHGGQVRAAMKPGRAVAIYARPGGKPLIQRSLLSPAEALAAMEEQPFSEVGVACERMQQWCRSLVET